MEKFYQRFKIDDHLKRHTKALQNLSQAGTDMICAGVACFSVLIFIGPERLTEAFSYVEKHQLYSAALSIWKGTEHYNVCVTT